MCCTRSLFTTDHCVYLHDWTVYLYSVQDQRLQWLHGFRRGEGSNISVFDSVYQQLCSAGSMSTTVTWAEGPVTSSVVRRWGSWEGMDCLRMAESASTWLIWLFHLAAHPLALTQPLTRLLAFAFSHSLNFSWVLDCPSLHSFIHLSTYSFADSGSESFDKELSEWMSERACRRHYCWSLEKFI